MNHPKQRTLCLDKFIMFAKDKAALDALISIKVQDNSVGDISKAVREDLINLRTFAMEYDVGIHKGKLPGCFAREFGMEVAPFVILCNPCQNEFEVAVEKKNGKVYFTHGWASLKGFYVKYVFCKQKFPWIGFCQSALPAEEAEITIVDYLGYSWKCWFKFNEDEDLSCIISDQWKHICEAHKFVEGTAMKFGVTTERNNFIMYIAPPPMMMVLRTKVRSSTIAAEDGPVYQLEQFFWKN